MTCDHVMIVCRGCNATVMQCRCKEKDKPITYAKENCAKCKEDGKKKK